MFDLEDAQDMREEIAKGREEYRSHGKRGDDTEAYLLSKYDRVKVTDPARLDSDFKDKRGVFIGYTSPRAYAEVRLDGERQTTLLHPESLTLDPMCAVDGCEFFHLDGVDYCPNHG